MFIREANNPLKLNWGVLFLFPYIFLKTEDAGRVSFEMNIFIH